MNGEALKNTHDESSRMTLYDWLQCIVGAVVFGILLFAFAVRIDGIQGPSMMQTLQNGDRVILTSLFSLKNGDIVFIKTDAYGDIPIVKRVIAMEGQTLDIDFSTGAVTLDGRVLRENYINTPTTLRENFRGPVTVPAGHVFVMGDNRNDSMDSRSTQIGLVDTRRILGKVLFVLIPGAGQGGGPSLGRIGSVYK